MKRSHLSAKRMMTIGKTNSRKKMNSPSSKRILTNSLIERKTSNLLSSKMKNLQSQKMTRNHQ